MDAEQALLDLLESTNYSDFVQRRDALKNHVEQEILLTRRDALLQSRANPSGPVPAPATDQNMDPRVFSSDPNERLLARRDALLEARAAQDSAAEKQRQAQEEWKRAVEAPMFTDRQRKFVRKAEFLLYMKVLDRLILSFDRTNTFNLVEAIDRTTQALNALRAFSLGMRESFGAIAQVTPSLPKRFFNLLARRTFVRYIRWQAALDLDR